MLLGYSLNGLQDAAIEGKASKEYMPLNDKDIQTLNSKYTWPPIQPDFDPADWSLDGGGRNIVISRICRNRPFLIIEIGSFLGSSAKQWLCVSPQVYVIAIDPWEGEWWVDYARAHGRNSLIEQFSRNDGPYLTFLSSLWEYRNRVFPVRGRSPEKLHELAGLNIQPDLIYFDSDKSGVDIEVAYQLFPSAILTGDDWAWGMEEGYPIRAAVRAFTQDHSGYQIITNRATWALVRPPVLFSEKFHTILNAVRDLVRIVRKLVK